MAAKFREYGQLIKDPRLAEIAVFLYKVSRADSTRKSYSVGQRHWVRFHNLHPEIAFFPFTTLCPDPVSLSLCFLQHTSHHVPKSHVTLRSGVIFVTSRLCGVTLVVGKSYLIPPSWLQLCAAYAAHSPHLLTCAPRSFYLFILLRAATPPPLDRVATPEGGGHSRISCYAPFRGFLPANTELSNRSP